MQVRRGVPNYLRRPSHGEGELTALHFVYVLERIEHEQVGWRGVITEVSRERGWLRVTWDRPGHVWLNQSVYSTIDFLETFDWDGPRATWLIKERRPV